MSGFVRHLDHVQLAIPPRGEDLGRAFFIDLLGFVEVDKPTALIARGGCWLQSGHVFVHLGVDPTFTPAKKAHPAFVVERFDELETTLLEAGYSFSRSDEIAGLTRAFTYDPFGNRIEFIAA